MSKRGEHEHRPDHVHADAHAHGEHGHPYAHAHAHAHDHDHDHDHDHEHAHSGHEHAYGYNAHAHEGHEHGARAHAHGHGHGHDENAAHEGHEHGHAHGERVREDAGRGDGQGKILFLDAPSGLAGDMIIAALVDLGVPERVITDAVDQLGLTGFHVHFGTRERSGIIATSFDVHVEKSQPERTYGAIRKMLDDSLLSEGVRARAHATFRRLAEAEAKVHRMPLEDVHFHEVGAVDAIVDVVGSAAALDYLGARLLVSPLPMGHGRVRARHGILPLPAPAVVECLRGHPTYDGAIEFELVTPTGAAVVGAHAEGASRWPSIIPERVGWGAGTADLADRPNLLRAVLGPSHDSSERSATHVVLEANIDDATGELLAHCIDALLHGGALDAWAVPIMMKKGRPAYTLAAIAAVGVADAVAMVMLRESTSLGVRRQAITRVERPRRTVQVATRFGSIPVKIAGGDFGRPQRKPEFDACLALAKAHGVSVREVLEAALIASQDLV